MADSDFTDILIAGGGPVGMMLALALRGSSASTLHVQAPAAYSAQGERPIALSYGSRLLLEGAGVWPETVPTEICEIHVSQQGGFGRTLIRAADCELPALGYVAPYSAILAWLSAAEGVRPGLDGKVLGWKPAADHIDVRVALPAGGETRRRARLLVLADGGQAGLEASGRNYGQHAVVADVQTERAHRNIAWERFTAGGPIALLPYQDHHALVWGVPENEVRPLLAMPQTEFLHRLGITFGSRLGAFTSAGPRAAFPLALRHRSVVHCPRAILVGNAAQTLHPVAGQGLNLGLRDAVELARLVGSTPGSELGSETFLKRYSSQRKFDRGAGIRFTDALVRVFSNSSTTLAVARGAGLALLDALPPARNFLARRMIFGARGLP